MDKAMLQSWLKFVLIILCLMAASMLVVFIVYLIAGWNDPDQYFSALFYLGAAFLVIGGYSIQSSWNGIRKWAYSMGRSASDVSSSDQVRAEIRDINQALGVWGKLSIVGLLLLIITFVAG